MAGENLQPPIPTTHQADVVCGVVRWGVVGGRSADVSPGHQSYVPPSQSTHTHTGQNCCNNFVTTVCHQNTTRTIAKCIVCVVCWLSILFIHFDRVGTVQQEFDVPAQARTLETTVHKEHCFTILHILCITFTLLDSMMLSLDDSVHSHTRTNFATTSGSHASLLQLYLREPT